MLPIKVFYGILILLVLLPLIIFRFSRYKNVLKINSYLALGLAMVAGLLWGYANQLLIVYDDNVVQEYALFFPQDYPLSNGKSVSVGYQFGWRQASVINNGQRPLIYEIVRYGFSDTADTVYGVLPYARLTDLPKPISYVFSEPPSSVRLTFFQSDLRAWIHR